MGNKLRALVATLLSLICLTVLSLHVALCLHYPSALFAVTLLLNPSLWLFIGLMSVFCTLLINYRDQRRKLVPALCTTCRPKHEGSPLIWKNFRGERFNREDLQGSQCHCHCSNRSLSTNCPSERSVRISAHFTDSCSDSLQVVSKVTEKQDFFDCSKDVQLRTESKSDFSSRADDKDIQNFSCLLSCNGKVDGMISDSKRISGSDRSLLTVSPQVHSSRGCSKIGRTAYCSYRNNQYRMYASHNYLSNQFRQPHHPHAPFDSSSSLDKADEDSVANCITLNDTALEGSEINLIDISPDGESHSSTRPYDSISSEPNAVCTNDKDQTANCQSSVSYSSGAIRKLRTPLNPYNSKYMSMNTVSRCTCPARYYLKYNTRQQLQIASKSKPIMKCSLIHRKNTPVHLFEVKPPQIAKEEKEQNKSLIDASEAKSSTPLFETEAADDNSAQMNRDCASFSSLVSLIPKQERNLSMNESKK